MYMTKLSKEYKTMKTPKNILLLALVSVVTIFTGYRLYAQVASYECGYFVCASSVNHDDCSQPTSNPACGGCTSVDFNYNGMPFFHVCESGAGDYAERCFDNIEGGPQGVQMVHSYYDCDDCHCDYTQLGTGHSAPSNPWYIAGDGEAVYCEYGPCD